MTTAIIVEDEISLRSLIKKLVHDIDPTIEILAECEDSKSAQNAIRTHSPDIIFLDVILPRGSGLDILASVPELKSEVIFITAYDKYVLEAFNHAAVGYILKPIDKKKLEHAIGNAKKRINEKIGNGVDHLIKYIEHNSFRQKIGIPTQEGITFVSCDNIIRCEGYNSYTKIYLTDGSCLLSSYNLSRFEQILSRSSFFKVHKSHIISISFVNKYHAKDGIIEMDNGDNIPISKRIKSEFMNFFKTPNR